MNNTLYHHGILGQRWGERNGPPYPLGSSEHSTSEKKAGWRRSLTNTENRHYNVDIEKAKINVQKAKSDYQTAYNQKELKKAKQAAKQEEYAKEDLKSEKVKSKLNNEKAISQHRANLEQYYRNKGMTDEEAAIAAYKREKTEKIVATTAALTVVAVASYVAYKHYNQTVDKIIPQDTILKRISTNGDQSVKDAFYAVMEKASEPKHIGMSDEEKYVGLYGKAKRFQGRDVFQKTIKVGNDLKLASEKNATKSLRNLINQDATYAKKLQAALESERIKMHVQKASLKQRAMVNKALKSLAKGKVDASVYEALNYGLVYHDSELTKKFYGRLISDGYDAIMDINDKKFSGYKANMPIIVFNSKKVAVEKVRELGDREIQDKFIDGITDVALKTIGSVSVKTIVASAGTLAGANAMVDVANSKKNDAIVAEYRKEHPDTQLSYTEIVRNQS